MFVIDLPEASVSKYAAEHRQWCFMSRAIFRPEPSAGFQAVPLPVRALRKTTNAFLLVNGIAGVTVFISGLSWRLSHPLVSSPLYAVGVDVLGCVASCVCSNEGCCGFLLLIRHIFRS